MKQYGNAGVTGKLPLEKRDSAFDFYYARRCQESAALITRLVRHSRDSHKYVYSVYTPNQYGRDSNMLQCSSNSAMYDVYIDTANKTYTFPVTTCLQFIQISTTHYIG